MTGSRALSVEAGSVHPPASMNIRCCNACGSPVLGGLCSYECDKVNEAGTFTVRYVPDRDKYIRAFNSLEKAVTKHTDDCPDCEDLKRAHRIVMRMLAERTI